MVPPTIDTTMTRSLVYGQSSIPFVTTDQPSQDYASPHAQMVESRNRSLSIASTSSSVSYASPGPSTGNGSSSSLCLPATNAGPSDGREESSFKPQHSPASSYEHNYYSHEPPEEYVLALHDFVPQQQNATCLSFRAGERIRVLNRDPSGWWDGELDGRRGWFPSNYVNKDIVLLTQEEMPKAPRIHRVAHKQTRSVASVASTASARSDGANMGHTRDEVPFPASSSHYPPLMYPLLHGLQLLQNTAHSRRITHYQPSVACIISCIRALLQATECLPRDAPLLRRHPVLAQERKRVLSDLAALVTQAKKASGVYEVEDEREPDEELMLKYAGQVFARVRRFLAVAVQCGIELPERRYPDGPSAAYDIEYQDRTPYGLGAYNTDDEEYYPPAVVRNSAHVVEAEESGRGSYDGERNFTPTSVDSCAPLIEAGDIRRLSVSAQKHEQYTSPSIRSRASSHRFHSNHMSISSSSSFSSSSSYDSPGTPITPPFPEGPCTSYAVLQALRVTHDNLLSTIAAFIGHVHSHSRSAHASSTGHLYELVRQVVEIVCRLLTITDAVAQHKDLPTMKIVKLEEAKDNLYTMASSLADSVKDITTSDPPTMTEEEERGNLLRLATDALRAGSDCVGAVKTCLSRPMGSPPLIVVLPSGGATSGNAEFEQSKRVPMETLEENEGSSYDEGRLEHEAQEVVPVQDVDPGVNISVGEEEDMTIQAPSETRAVTTVPLAVHAEEDEQEEEQNTEVADSTHGSNNEPIPDESSEESHSASTSPTGSDEDTGVTSPESGVGSSAASAMNVQRRSVRIDVESLPKLPQEEPDLISPLSEAPTDADSATWEASNQRMQNIRSLEDKLINGDLPSLPASTEDEGAPVDWTMAHDHAPQDVAYNSEGHLIGATLPALVERMTPHDSIVDASFAGIFFMTFRLFSTPEELVQILITRFNLEQPAGLSGEDLDKWRHQKLTPVRLRVSNFIKLWLETYWRAGNDDAALPLLLEFVRGSMSESFVSAAQRLEDLITFRSLANQATSPVSERHRMGDRLTMSLNAPLVPPVGEVPRPVMSRALLASLRSKNFSNVAVTDFDVTELARQLTIMESGVYCAVTPEEMLDIGQSSAPPAVNVKAVSSLSTVITGWVAECILDEHDIKKRTLLVKYFIKLADRCTSLNNFSTPRAILAALDSSTISRLHQTWAGLAQKGRAQLNELRKLADHARNYHEYRSRLRNTTAPAVPFLGLYLTDLTFCREGNQSHRPSPLAPEKKLVNFTKYQKLARIIQDMQRFQVPYNFKTLSEVQEYLRYCFDKSKDHGDLEDLYRRSLLVEPKQPADTPPSSELKQLFGWGNRNNSSQTSQATLAS